MQTVATQKAGDLPPGVKSAVEQLLGRLIEADEEVSVTAAPPQRIPPSENRARVAQQLDYFAYNFIEIHSTLRTTPATAAGVTDRLWEVSDLVAAWEAEERREDIAA
jgi:hypothetical protein